MKKNKLLIIGLLLLILSACTFNSVETYPSVDLPFTIVDETHNSNFFDDIDTGEEELVDKQIINSATLREITDDEAVRFVERKADQTTNLLKENYKAVEFDFGTANLLNNGKSLGIFDEHTTNFVYDKTIIPNKFYQILDYENRTRLYGISEKDQEDIIYATLYEDMKIISIVRNEYAQKGLQLRTTINDEEIYLDIEINE